MVRGKLCGRAAMDGTGILCQICLTQYKKFHKFKQHLYSKEHQQKMKGDFQTDVSHGAGFVPHIIVMESLNRSDKQPILGLSLMTVCFSQGVSTVFYLCHVCESNCSSNTILSHLSGSDHNVNYFNYTDPNKLHFSWIPSRDIRVPLSTEIKEDIKSAPRQLQMLNLPKDLLEKCEKGTYSEVISSLRGMIYNLLETITPKRLLIQAYQKDSKRKHPLLGLQHLIECVSVGHSERKRYLCTLCNLTLAPGMPIRHILSFDHIFNYFKVWHPSTLMSRESYKNYTHDFSSMMLDLARQTQNIHGGAHTEIRQVHLEPEVFASVNFSSYAEALTKLESITKAKNESSLITPVNPGNKLVRCPPSSYKLQCQNCSMSMSDSEYSSHVATVQHKMMVKQSFGGAGNMGRNELAAWKPNVDVYRNSKKQKAIGVSLVVMCFSSQVQEQPLYVCVACKDSFHESSLKLHLDSKKHLVLTLLHQNPWQLPLCWRDKPNEAVLRSKAREDEKKRESTPMKVLDIPHQRFSKLSPPSYATVTEELAQHLSILEQDVPLSHNATKPNERFPQLALNFLVMYTTHMKKREQFLCLLCNRKLTDDESHTHSFSWEHVGKVMLHFHHGSLNSSTFNIEALQNLAKQAMHIHGVSHMQVIQTKRPIPEIWPYKDVTTFLSCEKRKNGKGPLEPPIVPKKKLEVTIESLQEEKSQEGQSSSKNSGMIGASEKKTDPMSTDKGESVPSVEEKLFSTTNSKEEATSSEASRFNEGARKRPGIMKSPDSSTSDAAQCKKRRVSFGDHALSTKKPKPSGGKQATTADGGQSLKSSPKTTDKGLDAPPHCVVQPFDPQHERLVAGPKEERTPHVSEQKTQSAMQAHVGRHEKSPTVRLSDAGAADRSAALCTHLAVRHSTGFGPSQVADMDISDEESAAKSIIESEKLPSNQDVKMTLSKVSEAAGNGREKPSVLHFPEKETSTPVLHYDSRGLKSDHSPDSVHGTRTKLGENALKSTATPSIATTTTSPTVANPRNHAERAAGKSRVSSSKGAGKSSAPASDFRETSTQFKGTKVSTATTTNATSSSKSASSPKRRESRSGAASTSSKSASTHDTGSTVVCDATYRTSPTSNNSQTASCIHVSASSSAPASAHIPQVNDSSTGSSFTCKMPVQKPLEVGLHYVIKVTCGEKKQVYCLLCRVRLTDSNHTVTPSHYYNYVKATLPGLHLNRSDLSTLLKTVRQVHDIEKNSRKSLGVQGEKVTKDVYKELKSLSEQEAIQRLEEIMKRSNTQRSSSPSSANDTTEASGRQVVVISPREASSPDVIILDSSSEEETEPKVMTRGWDVEPLDVAPTDTKSKSTLASVLEICPETLERRQPDPELKTVQKKVEESWRNSPLVAFDLDCYPPSGNTKQKNLRGPGQKGPADSEAGPAQHGAPQTYSRITIGEMVADTSYLSTWLKVKNLDGVIGLASVWECRGKSLKTFFLCESCRETLSKRDICQHMVSSKHQSNYVLSQVPELSSFWSKKDLLPEVKEYILKRVAAQEHSEGKDAQMILMVQELYEWVETAPFSEALKKVQEIKRVKKLTEHLWPRDPALQAKDQQPEDQWSPISPSGPPFQTHKSSENETRPKMKKLQLDESGKPGDVYATRECSSGASCVHPRAADPLSSSTITYPPPHGTFTDVFTLPALLTSQGQTCPTMYESDVKNPRGTDSSFVGSNTLQMLTKSPHDKYPPSKKRPDDERLCTTDPQLHDPLPTQLTDISVRAVTHVPDSTTSDEEKGCALDELSTSAADFVQLKNLLYQVRDKSEMNQSQPATDSSEKTAVEESVAKRWDSPTEKTPPQMEKCKNRWDSRCQHAKATVKRKLSHGSPEGEWAAAPADIVKDFSLQGAWTKDSLSKATEARVTDSMSPSMENLSVAGLVAHSRGTCAGRAVDASAGPTPQPKSKTETDTSMGCQWPIQVIIGSNPGPAKQQLKDEHTEVALCVPSEAAAPPTNAPPASGNYGQLNFTRYPRDGHSGYPFTEAAPNPTAPDKPPVLTGSQGENQFCGVVYPGQPYPEQEAEQFTIIHFGKSLVNSQGWLPTLQLLQRIQPQIHQSQLVQQQMQQQLVQQQMQQIPQPQLVQQQIPQPQLIQYQIQQQILQPGIQQPQPIQLKQQQQEEQQQYCPWSSAPPTAADGTIYHATSSGVVPYPEQANPIHSSFVHISEYSTNGVSPTLSRDTMA